MINYLNLPTGKSSPNEVNAVIEISRQARINEMLGLLEHTKSSLEEIQQIQKKFDALHLRYGAAVPPEVRKHILYQ